MRETLGKFRILGLIGRGAMGEVYLGEDPLLNRKVAIKTIRDAAALGEEAAARFQREARAAGGMSHPHVATVFEFGQDGDLSYMAMEYVEGEDLEALIRRRGAPTHELLELLAQACEGLAYAHERGVVHRDVKPANILVSRSDKRPLAKLVDFGVALVGDSNLTRKGDWMGTVNYMAPEYLDTGKATPACDLFAMGVILYEILSGGRRPFAGETATLVLNAILRQPPAPLPPEETQHLNPALLDILNRALAKDPRDRFPSAGLLAAALRAALAPVVQAPAPTPAPAEEGNTLVVGKGGAGQCMSLRVALRQAKAGGRIQVLPGVYRESLRVDKPVSIQGKGGPGEVVLESPKGPCMAIEAPGVALGNLSLRGAGEDPVLRVAAGQLQVEDCTLENQGGPLFWAVSGTDSLFRDTSLTGRGPQGGLADKHAALRLERCLLEGAFAVGLAMESGARLSMAGCRVRVGQGLGISLQPGAQARLEDCDLGTAAAGGLEVEAEARAELKGCRLLDSGSVGLLVLERGQAALEDCDLGGHPWAALHVLEGAGVQLRACRLRDNGLGVSVMGQALVTLDACDLEGGLEPAVRVHRGGTVQMKACRVHDGQSYGVVCAGGGRGVLEGCEIFGNALTGAKVEPGGSLLLVRCDLRDGRDTGILLFEDAEVTLEECVVHRNARGGILLAKDASDPVLRGDTQVQDGLLRASPQGGLVRVTPLRSR